MKKISIKHLGRKFKKVLYKIYEKLSILAISILATSYFSKCFASSISTAEVSQATENVKNAIIKLAMPIRRNFSIYKYCNYFIKDDCKFKQC